MASVSNRLLTSVDFRLIPALFLQMVQKVMVLPWGRLALSGGNVDV